MVRKRFLTVALIAIVVVLSSCTRTTQSVEPPREDKSGQKWADETNIKPSETNEVNSTDERDSAELKDKVIPRVAFSASEYSRLSSKGSGTVRGVIYLDDGYGAKVYGQNTRLYLNPVTSYSRQWFNESYTKGYKLSKADSRLYNYLKFTTSDGSGKFAFFGVPSGKYYVIGSVDHKGQKMRIADEIYVSGSSVTKTVLSREVR